MINDLQARDLLYKYMDDSTVTEEVSDPADSHLQEDTDNIVQWSKICVLGLKDHSENITGGGAGVEGGGFHHQKLWTLQNCKKSASGPFSG